MGELATVHQILNFCEKTEKKVFTFFYTNTHDQMSASAKFKYGPSLTW